MFIDLRALRIVLSDASTSRSFRISLYETLRSLSTYNFKRRKDLSLKYLGRPLRGLEVRRCSCRHCLSLRQIVDLDTFVSRDISLRLLPSASALNIASVCSGVSSSETPRFLLISARDKQFSEAMVVQKRGGQAGGGLLKKTHFEVVGTRCCKTFSDPL